MREKAKVARELPVESRGLQRRSKRGVNTAVPTATPRWCKYWAAYGKRGVQLGSSPREVFGFPYVIWPSEVGSEVKSED